MCAISCTSAVHKQAAGAVAVMALERVPADIRKDGGVARMSDPVRVFELHQLVTAAAELPPALEDRSSPLKTHLPSSLAGADVGCVAEAYIQ
jgi:hypothetical protein